MSDSNVSAGEADLKMAVEYNGSTVAAIDMDSKIGYKQFFSEGSKFQYSGKETLASFRRKDGSFLKGLLVVVLEEDGWRRTSRS